MAIGSKKVESIWQFWLILIFHRNPALKQDCETWVKKCLYFIEDSERPGQNPYKNALKSEGGGGEQS